MHVFFNDIHNRATSMRRILGKEKPEVFHAFQTEWKGKQSECSWKKKLVVTYASWRAQSILGVPSPSCHQTFLEDSRGRAGASGLGG